MDRRFEDVETNSTVDNTLGQMDTSDPEIQSRALARGIDAGQLLAGDVGPVAVGPRTDADARQAADPDTVGHLAAHFTPRNDLAATPPSAAAEANGVWRGTAHSTIPSRGHALWSASCGIRSRGCRPECSRRK